MVIDPSTRRLTHLIVRPHDREDHAVLVVANRACPREGSDAISLDGTVAEISQLEPVPKIAYLGLGEFPVDDPGWDVGIQEMSALPTTAASAPRRLARACPESTLTRHDPRPRSR